MVTVGTDSYGDESGLRSYAAARGVTIVGDESQLLIRAMDWLESRAWAGERYLSTQALSFPRYPLVSLEDTLGATPARIITAQYAAALLIDSGEDLGSVAERAVKRESIGRGAVETEYMDNSGSSKQYPQLQGLIGRYLAGGGAGFQVVRV